MDKDFQYRSPLVYQRADPFVLCKDGIYYFTGSVPQYDLIELRCAKSLDGLAFANSRIIWRRHESGDMSAHIWAPEIHFIDGVWYIYFTAGASEDKWAIRPYALVCEGDPMKDEWREAGRIDVGHDSFSLDMTSLVIRGRQYLAWAQVTDKDRGSEILIAEAETPIKLSSKPTVITTPEYEWEKRGFKVNEGPAFLHRNGRVFLTYSASDTGTSYCMGMLWAKEDADLLDPGVWHKLDTPVFETCEENSQYGPGHNSFTTDGEHDVMVYHSRNYPEIWSDDPLYDPNRHAHAIRVSYDENGFPIFGKPVKDNS